MELNIRNTMFLIKDKTYDCFQENILKPICEEFDLNMKINFVNLFDFNVDIGLLKENIFFSECLNAFSMDRNYLDAFLAFGGVRISKVTDKCQKKLQVHKEGICGVKIDSYFLPWNEYYGQLHRDHFVLIVDSSVKEFLIYDKYLNNNYQVIDRSLLESQCEELLYFEKLEVNRNRENIKKYILNGIDFSSNIYRKNQIILLANEMKRKSRFSSLTVDELVTSPFMYQINCMLNYRMNFSKCMKSLSETNMIDNTIIDFVLLEKICDEWMSLKNRIIKRVIKKDVERLHIEIADAFVIISELEYDFMQKIIIKG